MTTNTDNLILASINMCSTSDWEKNLDKAFSLVYKAKKSGANWILLPELFTYFGAYGQLYGLSDEEGSGPIFQGLSALAKELSICLFAGSIPERPPSGLPHEILYNGRGERRVYNTLYVFDRMGQLAGKYRKTHLFNLFDENGQPLYAEGDGFIPGDRAVAIDLEGFRVGLSICYDLRFPEYYAKLNKDGPLDVIVLPAAFTKETGAFHWELLLKARAIENQCYVFAANQYGFHYEHKVSFGHSMVVDPWGTVLDNALDEEGYAIATLDRDEISKVRSRLPVLKNRRPEIY
ncbi:MAG: carbon-nitrogen hydrolase family protein [Oligoflexales bacterium]|nr:carbon-nitrogen hydrolase family protein [Oligoflexales bacterium]